MPTGKLHIVPLGGMGEFGMNCMAIRYGDDIIVVDAGLMFPETELLGVDIVVPDISYLLENRAHVRGIILTHGHEDHIGGLPWVLSELNVPVWGTEFTLSYVEDKLDEHQLLDDADLRDMRAGERFKIGPFTIHPLQVTHSLVDCVALAIHTPLGVVLHTGDFKVDPTPTDNRLFDLHSFAEYGKEGVLALLQDSTNVERKGYTPSERAVHRKFEEIFVRTERRLFISCFSSSIHRIKLAVDMAWEHGRKICFIGRSMNSSSEIAEDLGYIDDSGWHADSSGRDEELSAGKSLCDDQRHAGRAAVGAVARGGRQPQARQDRKGRYRRSLFAHHSRQRKSHLPVIDHLFRREAFVVYDDGSYPPVHVSGHASQEELKLIINLVRPKYFIPIHGEYRQLKLHAELAGTMRGAVGNVMLIESGDVLEIDELGARKAGRVNVGRVCIDSGSRTDVVEDLVIKDRRHLSEDGFVMPIIAINKLTGRVESAPEIVTRGFAPGENGVIERAREIVHGDAGCVQRRRESGLRRDQGKDPDRSEALYLAPDAAAAADYAGDTGDLKIFRRRDAKNFEAMVDP